MFFGLAWWTELSNTMIPVVSYDSCMLCCWLSAVSTAAC